MWEHSNKVALLFGINDYGGSSNDLNGCLNDIALVKSKLPDFQIREFKDSQVTRRCFREQIEYAITNSQVGDVIYIHYSGHGSYVKDISGDEIDGYDETLYLFDGNLVDDTTNEILRCTPLGVYVIVALDSCFSGTATRNPHKVRFMPPKKKFPAHVRVKKPFREAGMNWIVMSGCSENQSSADADINGTFNGAFTFYQMNAIDRQLTYKKWFEKIRLYLPNKEFEQIPTLEGDESLVNRLIFT